MSRMSAIFIDMDGVLSNFVKGVACDVFGRTDSAYAELLEKWPEGEYSVHVALGLGSEDEMWDKVDNRGLDFWVSLERYPWAQSLWDACRSVAPVFVASSPSRNPEAAKGKVAWLQQWHGRKFRDFFITPWKHLLAQEDRLLIDDSDEVVGKWKEREGRVILFPRPWNANHKYADDPIEYTLAELFRIVGGN